MLCIQSYNKSLTKKYLFRGTRAVNVEEIVSNWSNANSSILTNDDYKSVIHTKRAKILPKKAINHYNLYRKFYKNQSSSSASSVSSSSSPSRSSSTSTPSILSATIAIADTKTPSIPIYTSDSSPYSVTAKKKLPITKDKANKKVKFSTIKVFDNTTLVRSAYDWAKRKI